MLILLRKSLAERLSIFIVKERPRPAGPLSSVKFKNLKAKDLKGVKSKSLKHILYIIYA